MQIKHQIQEGLSAIQANKTRTIITCSIILLGITALVGILTSVDALKNAVAQAFNQFGSNSFTINSSFGLRRLGEKKINYDNIDYSQASWFRDNFKSTKNIALSTRANFNTKVQYLDKATDPNVMIMGADANYIVNGYAVEKGRNFNYIDEKMGRPVIIIGTDVRYKLFGNKSGIGKAILVNSKKYQIIGELATKGSSMGMSGGDRIVFLPNKQAQLHNQNSTANYDISVSVKKEEELENNMEEARLYMRQIRRLKAHEPDDFAIQSGDAVAKKAIDQMGMISSIGGIISAITLLGAAIGLMNIMLVSVTERTREIGLRKALGAQQITIRNQFLTEAIVICQLGGIGGIILGTLVGNLVAMALGTTFVFPWKWMILSVVVCTIVGLASGIYPANKAAKLDPIDSLRYE